MTSDLASPGGREAARARLEDASPNRLRTWAREALDLLDRYEAEREVGEIRVAHVQRESAESALARATEVLREIERLTEIALPDSVYEDIHTLARAFFASLGSEQETG